MPPPLDENLPAEADRALQHLLAGQPGLALPADVRNRIMAALAAEAATRAALTGNDADPATPPHPFTKASEPVREADDLA
jgi:hypothetical protein